jgi:DNA-binding NtrC family response regulator
MNIDNKTVVLIVDEDLALATVIERTLRDEFESISIEIATDGKQALEVLERQKIGVALVDTHLPDIPGIELLSKLKAKDSTIEIIMISAFGTIELAIQAVKQGALDFLTKPFERAEFILHSFRKIKCRRNLNTIRCLYNPSFTL